MILAGRKHVETVISRIIHIYDKIEKVKDNTHLIADHLKYEYYDFVNVLSCKKIQMEESLEALKRATADTYDEALKNVERTIEELNHILNTMKVKFNR
jgi:hypothetical protein